MNDTDYCKYIQVPLDLIVGNVPKFPDRLRVYLLLCHYDRELDYGSIGRILGLTVPDVKKRCAELVADGLVERLNGKARFVAAGLPDADPDRLRAYRGVMGKREGKNGHHKIQVPLKVSRKALDAALSSSLKYRFTDEEFAFLQDQKALTELRFWSTTLPDKCFAVGLVEEFAEYFPKLDAKESTVIWCVRGAMVYANTGHRILNLSGWLLTVLGKLDGAKNHSLWNEVDQSDRSLLPTLAERLGLASTAAPASTPENELVWVEDLLPDEAA